MIRNTPRRKFQRGTSIVEFALVAPLFFLLLFGIIEWSVILFDKAVITNASREGAREAILYRPGARAYGSSQLTTTEKGYIDAAVTAYATNSLLSLGGASSITTAVTYTNVGGNAGFDQGDTVEVIVSYPYSFLILPGFVAGMTDFTLAATTIMRAE